MIKRSYVIFLFCTVFSFITISETNAQTSQEKNVKAAFIYNFTRYIYWSNFDSTDFFKIGIYGDSEILEPLQEIAAKKRVDNKKILIEHYPDISTATDCEIVILSKSLLGEAETILKRITNKNVLIIGESEGFAQLGAAIDFVTWDGTMKFEINQQALKKSGLIVSSQLLKLALLVD